ncbi:MAG: PBP1A family penicillin-binding protein [Thermoleophilia bacterium]|nr:PBP1A family penicillin-binding protein [Thermoleophilia bacterium]
MLVLVVVGIASGIAGVYVALLRSVPATDLSGQIVLAESTKVFTNSNPPVLIAELHGPENREVLSGDEIPQVMRDAVVAIEDSRFYEHQGVDFWGILRAFWTNIRHGEIVQGGSTITQQLIKNLYVGSERTYTRKLREAVLAYQLERKWSKEKILNEYLNIVYFGEGAYGVGAAARTYFGISAKQLSLDQAALLAGLLKAPSAYSPRSNPEGALARRNLVLNKMYQQQFITSAQLQEALAAPLQLVAAAKAKTSDFPYWVEMIREQLVAKYGASRVLGGGLRVYISMEPKLQQAAEQAVAAVLDQPGDPEAALVCVDVRTGQLVAMVGGSDFTKRQFNLATQGRRQPGSAFKPFALVAALKAGISPENVYDSGPVTFDLPGGPWQVSSEDRGRITLKEATAISSNGVYARLVMEIGAQAVADAAYALGITTPLGDPPNPAIALGGLRSGVSPLEMAMAYATLATGGERLTSQTVFDPSQANWPITIIRVTDARGRVLDENSVVRNRVLDEGLAALATTCLLGVIQSGTGKAADIGRPAAGKTGTTQNYCDAWFVGYTPELVTAVWVGYPETRQPMMSVHGIKVTGGSFPAQIWARFMRTALENTPVTDFDLRPAASWISAQICKESGFLAVEQCPEKVFRLFPQGQSPDEPCPLHAIPKYAVPNVIGHPVEDARTELQGLGFIVATRKDTLATGPAGLVVGQDPPPGTMLEKGGRVTLRVAAPAPTLVTVPSLTGLDADTARQQLQAVGLKWTEVFAPHESPYGTVVYQEPPPGAEVLPGSAVSLIISSGPEATTSTSVSPVPSSDF